MDKATDRRFVSEFREAGMRIAQEISGWTSAAARWSRVASALNAALQPTVRLGGASAHDATEAAIAGARPEIHHYAVSMNSGTRKVLNQTDETRRMWIEAQDIWDNLAEQDPQMVSDTRKSFTNLVSSAEEAVSDTRTFKEAMAGFRDFAQQEVDEALEAQEAAIRACESLADLGNIVVGVLTRSLET